MITKTGNGWSARFGIVLGGGLIAFALAPSGGEMGLNGGAVAWAQATKKPPPRRARPVPRPAGSAMQREQLQKRMTVPGSSTPVSPMGALPPTRSGKLDRSKAKSAPSRGVSGAAPAAAAADGSDPWSTVNMPGELSSEIEFKKPKWGTKFSFNLVDANLIDLIKMIGNITGKSFILGGKVPNIKATIFAPTKITAQEAYKAFLSVLEVNGLTVIPAGKYLKILPVGGSVAKNTPIYNRTNVPASDQIVTRIHRLKHVSAEELVDLVSRFKSPNGDITVHAPTNTLIITDHGTAIRRVLKLLRVFDKPGTGDQIWIEPINYADATELGTRIMEIFDPAAAGARPGKKPVPKGKRPGKGGGVGVVGVQESETKITKILPDERTNSLIIVASENAYLRILEMIKRLDVPIAGEGTLHVHKLQHADATELAKTLNNLSRNAKRGAKGKKKGKGVSGGGGLFEGEMQISADKATNSLVIVSSLRDYVNLKTVIDELDVMQRQVFVEAVIMEVSLDKNRSFGLGFHAGSLKDIGIGDEQSLIYGMSQPNQNLNSLLLSAGAMSGLAAGIRGPEIEGTEDLLGPGISIPAFGIVLQALQTNSDVNVLSMPHILATDNEEASISVGENVPIQQGYNPASALIAGAAGGNNTNNAAALMGGLGGFGGFGMSIGRQNVGLELKLTPHINDDDQVRLEINLKIEELKTADPTLNPNISRQHAATTSVVKDQQTIVIGGLITDNEVETIAKVPLLGDIPILGAFFRQKSSVIKKRNLLIFLTPYIIRSADDFREIFTRKMAERREFIERYTAFEYHRVDPHLDWSRTNGGLTEINKIVSEAEKDELLRQRSEIDNTVEHNRKEPIKFIHPDDLDEPKAVTDQSAAQPTPQASDNTATVMEFTPAEAQ